MAITYHAGRRIQGLASDLTATQFPSSAVGGWVELGRHTLTQDGDTITVSNLANKRYLMVLGNFLPNGNINPAYQFNGDSSGTDTVSGNYATRASGNGATPDSTELNKIYLRTDTIAGNNFPLFNVNYIANYASKEKLMISHSVKHDGNGANIHVKRIESVGKWNNTTDAINRIDAYQYTTGDLATGSEVVVLGYDPSDTHTTNFWEQLADVDLSGGASTSLSTGVFTAKKYLWIQLYAERNGGGAQQPILRVGNNTVDSSGTQGVSGNYTIRWTQNGASDGTYAYRTSLGIGWGNLEHQFHNIFILNNATQEKLVFSHGVGRNGSGANVPPDRSEYAGKWANTSNQINIIELLEQDGFTFGTKTKMKVWGAN